VKVEQVERDGVHVSSAKSASGRVLCKNERATNASGEYQTVTVNTAECNKMALVHHLANHGWQLVSTAFANNTDNVRYLVDVVPTTLREEAFV
jgi:hypothetical protein